MLEKLGKDTAATLLTVAPAGERAEAARYLEQVSSVFARKPLSRKVLEHPHPAEAILDEARKEYDLVVLGASERGTSSETVFNPIVDYILRLSPTPTMVVKGDPAVVTWPPKRILVPTNGSEAARQAARPSPWPRATTRW